MSRRCVVSVYLLVSLCVPALLQAADKQPTVRTDSLGDPLPAGAVARLGSTRFWYGASVGAVALSPDGKVVATGGAVTAPTSTGSLWRNPADRTIRLWDTSSGKEVRRFEAPKVAMTSLCFSPDGKSLAGSGDGLVCVWDAATGRQLRRFEFEVAQECRGGGFVVRGEGCRGTVEFSADGKMLKLTSYNVDTWDLADGGRHRHWEAPRPRSDNDGCFGAALSPDGKVVVWAFYRQVPSKTDKPIVQEFLTAHDAVTGRKLYEVELKGFSYGGLVFSPDGKLLAQVRDGGFVLREAATGKLVRQVKRPDELQAPFDPLVQLAFTADGKTVAGLSRDGTAQLWETATGKALYLLPHQHGTGNFLYSFPAPCLSFAVDGKTLAVAASTTVLLWDVPTGVARSSRPGHREAVERVAFSPNGRQLFSAADVLCSWRVDDWRQVGRAPLQYLQAQATLAISADGRLFVEQPHLGALQLHETVTGKERHRLRPWDSKQQTVFLGGTFSSDSCQVIVLGGQQTTWFAEVYDTATGKSLRRWPLKEQAASSAPINFDLALPWLFQSSVRVPRLVCSADGRLLAWYDLETTVRVIDLETGKTVGAFEAALYEEPGNVPAPLLVFSPDGRYLARMRDGQRTKRRGQSADYALHVYEVATGREALRLDMRQANGNPAPVACVAFSPDGRTLAVGRYDEDMVRVWEVASGQERHTFRGHLSAVSCLAFAPDGKSLASGSYDTTILVWDVDGSRTAGRTARPGAQELEALWLALEADAARAGQAVGVLARHPEEAVSFLATRLRPAATPAPERAARLIAELGDGRFAVRAKATQALEQLHSLAEPALREAVTQAANLETRRRLERLLQQLQGPVTMPAVLREVRGVEVLERAGTAEARQALQRLANGAPAARLTQEARAALRRWHLQDSKTRPGA